MQAQADQEGVEELEMASSLPKAKQVDFLFAEADGVFVRGLEKRQKAMKEHDWNSFKLWVDTYESTVADTKKQEKIEDFRKYIQHNRNRISDWREKIEDALKDARGMGAIECSGCRSYSQSETRNIK